MRDTAGRVAVNPSPPPAEVCGQSPRKSLEISAIVNAKTLHFPNYRVGQNLNKIHKKSYSMLSFSGY